MFDSIFNLIQNARSFWSDSGLGLPKTGSVDEYAGMAIAHKKDKEEHDKMFDDHCKELDVMLKSKHLY